MLDSNQVAQIGETAQAVKTQVTANWPFICAVALWLRTELKNFSEYVMGHGGFGMMAIKLLWNPPTRPGELSEQYKYGVPPPQPPPLPTALQKPKDAQ